MIIKKYGITLRTIREEDLELVRTKRNSEEIRQKMHYRELITPEMQKAWFYKINNAIYNNELQSFYFIIECSGKRIGLINGKNIDFKKRTSEGGFFIWEKEYLGTLLPAMASLITLDYSFLINEFNSNYIKVIKSNTNALNFNKMLGYSITNSDAEFYYLTLNKEDYLLKARAYRKIIGKETGDSKPLSLDEISLSDTSDKVLMKQYPYFEPILQKCVLEVLKREGRKVGV